jgi:methionyl-tRNA synthetase
MRYLITSALPYINGIKHLGNLVGSMLPADIYARYLRQCGHEVLYVCGTDEHGTPAELAAEVAGQSPRAFCDAMHTRQGDIYAKFNICMDHFGRSSSPTNHELTQQIFMKLRENGFIEERVGKQFFSRISNRFLPDRYIVGTCPHCRYPSARGDQCDSCGQLMDPLELINPRSSLSPDDALELRETRHVFLRLDALQLEVDGWIDGRVHWPLNVRSIAKKWIAEGLHPRSISRDLEWGIPVPLEGWDGKVFYVWFDAPIAYISITKDWAERQGDPDAWRQWWQRPDDVRLIQFMAKDNVPFHTVFWPATMLGTRQPWTMADTIKGYNWLTYEGSKFSTSEQRGVFTDDASELFNADYWRYGLMSMLPESDDSDFSFTRFATAINKELADGLGNLLHRVSALTKRYYDGRIALMSAPLTETERALLLQLHAAAEDYVAAMDEVKLRQAQQTLRRMWSLADAFITRAEPWRTAKSDPVAAERTLAMCLHVLRVSTVFAAPFIPDAATAIWRFLGQDGTVQDVTPTTELFGGLEGVGTPWILDAMPPMFEKITPEVCEALVERFAGRRTPTIPA